MSSQLAYKPLFNLFFQGSFLELAFPLKSLSVIRARDFSSVASLCLKTLLSYPALLARCDLPRCLQCLKKVQTAKGLSPKMSAYVVMRVRVKPK